MNKIRVNSGIVVEVNDAGETITVNVEDQQLVARFYQMIEKLDAIKANVEAAGLQGANEGEKIQFMIEQSKEIMAEIDLVFGAECCRKVFGDIVPNPYLIADFFDQMTPVIKQYTDKRKESIAAKYSSKRKGAKR